MRYADDSVLATLVAPWRNAKARQQNNDRHDNGRMGSIAARLVRLPACHTVDPGLTGIHGGGEEGFLLAGSDVHWMALKLAARPRLELV